MQIIDAVWEKRNLGVTTQEVTVSINDTTESIKTTLQGLNAQYQVIKIPAGYIEPMWMLEDEGFHYTETTVHVVHHLKNLELMGPLQRIDAQLTYERMNENDVDQMYDEIRKGLFYTDRIALDPFFSFEQACGRYVGWIHDEIEKGTEIYKYIYKDKTVGFFTFKEIEEGIYYPFLAGIYKEYQKLPLGMLYTYKPLIEAKKRNGKCISTYISMNNSNAVRMHAQFGFGFKEVNNVYIRHCS